MSVLEEILRHKEEDLKRAKGILPLPELKASVRDAAPVLSFRQAIERGQDSGINLIAEIKKASPSKGVIRENFDLSGIADIYDRKNVDAISVLTERHFFQGSIDYLRAVRKITKKPLLRKDFIFDEYQVYESRVSGADAILLIVSCLEQSRLKDLRELAKELSLDSIVEVHGLKELETALSSGADIIGINNRNLKTLEIDLNTTVRLLKDIPRDRIVVSESGINTRADVEAMKAAGVDAILVGTVFMKSMDIGAKIDELMGKSKKI
ncbi:MAG: indole-3-glycerol phosphate synthase TrpC [Nitrospirae bacterium]|nr:indole-3-glycerol phosphate synthase TrpC [Nitrospirota bacterium]